jgi:A/G-specific adenine glycosylase
VLVSEIMLQQTQVATVVPYFQRFVKRFPDLASLAGASEQQVLRLWQGLGYYSRARRLLEAAKVLVRQHGGVIPSDPRILLGLPGIGRYTAGAVASLAFDRQVPVLDGNVARVLGRLHNLQADGRSSAAVATLWQHAAELVPRWRPGDFNSALMELGAMICTPRSPACEQCPVASYCKARRHRNVGRAAATSRLRPRPTERRCIIAIHHRQRWLLQRRPPEGRWAGLWQFLTIVAPAPATDAKALSAACGLRLTAVRRIGQITHDLTHRHYEFVVYFAKLSGRRPAPRAGQRWLALNELARFPLPKPHLMVAQMLATTNRRRAAN